MIDRTLTSDVRTALRNFPAVAILGARQVGKTTLAKTIAREHTRASLYLDLENPADREKLHDASTFLDDNRDKLIVLDEMQRMPHLFAELRSLIDHHRKYGRFLLLGSAAPQLVRGVSESLTGRIFNVTLHPIGLRECTDKIPMRRHWFRGGFPEMLTSKSDLVFAQRMDAFISTFIERDLQNLYGVVITQTTMRRLLQMLAHANGSIWNAEAYARSLGVTAPTVLRYLDFLEGAFMVHRLPAFYFNARKRIIKAPKVYLTDTGMMHRLVRISSWADLHGHPSIGASWEAYIVEQIFQTKRPSIDLFYYRTQDGAEADVVLAKAGIPVACVEIKLSNAPTLSRGLYQSIADLQTKKNFVVIPSGEPYRKDKDIVVSGATPFLTTLLPSIR